MNLYVDLSDTVVCWGGVGGGGGGTGGVYSLPAKRHLRMVTSASMPTDATRKGEHENEAGQGNCGI